MEEEEDTLFPFLFPSFALPQAWTCSEIPFVWEDWERLERVGQVRLVSPSVLELSPLTCSPLVYFVFILGFPTLIYPDRRTIVTDIVERK